MVQKVMNVVTEMTSSTLTPTINIPQSLEVEKKKQSRNMKIITFLLVAVGSSGILKGKQKLGVNYISDKLDSIDFTKFSELTMSSV